MKLAYKLLILLLVLFVCTSCGFGQTDIVSKPAPGTQEEQHLAQQLLSRINQDRAATNHASLGMDSRLQQSAYAHNRVMANGCGLQHACPQEDDVGTRIQNQGVDYQYAGENIGDAGPIGDTDAWGLVSMMHSDMMQEQPPNNGHRQNLLSENFTHIGINVYIDSHATVWVTEDFSD